MRHGAHGARQNYPCTGNNCTDGGTLTQITLYKCFASVSIRAVCRGFTAPLLSDIMGKRCVKYTAPSVDDFSTALETKPQRTKALKRAQETCREVVRSHRIYLQPPIGRQS